MIIFKKPNDKIDFNFRIKLNGHLLHPSDSVKYLGILLDPALNWKHHCDVLSKRLQRANGMLMKIRHYVQKKRTKIHLLCSILIPLDVWQPNLGTAQ